MEAAAENPVELECIKEEKETKNDQLISDSQSSDQSAPTETLPSSDSSPVVEKIDAEQTLNDSGCHSGSSDPGQGSSRTSEEKEIEEEPCCSKAATALPPSPEKGILRKDGMKRKRPLRFSSVREFLFQRKQSFCTLPSTGGCALGMDEEHHEAVSFPIPLHRERLNSKRRKKLRQWRAKQRKIAAQTESGQAITSDHSSENDSDSDAPEEDLTGVDEWWFLQPIAPKKRRKILKKNVDDVDSSDRLNNRVLRSSREVCGCSCIDVCHPATCECSNGGIPCQVDRDGFPCPCQVGRCGNPSGRRSFNSARVRHHFFKTMYKLRCNESPSRENSPSSSSEVRTGDVQQPYSFGDFTKPSDFQGAIYLPQQWDQQTSLSEWTSVPEIEDESRLCDNLPSVDDNSLVLQPNVTASSESSTEDGSVDGAQEQPNHDQTEPDQIANKEIHTQQVTITPTQPASMNETNITVMNEESSRDSDLTV
ncbi:Oidioi.mRNA.OKI2018_I69.chr2.g4228.t1.cds [Oikopleura dioica]|uniref:Oidioi.mRNA.OKI2018_I69.chr2.g4228.t1.cds n=1 Tax=Oikopleura dioica TaxID=34765 RepID=A0ABN7SWB3_OIKDI|nr:Oidioi.mRNA.OKI2018_I69.chr2.g4228.t1.cds [Oikopleura dioica]